jgi:hypothetical protein
LIYREWEGTLDSNSSFRWKFFLLGVAAILLSQGCTKEIPLQAVYSGESDWSPGFSIYYNNYQRINGVIDSVPRMSLLRNIDRMEVQGKTSSADSFMTISIAYMPVSTRYQGSFSSGPILNMGQTYLIRLATFYRDGVVRYSDDTTIISPIVFGKIAKSLVLSQGPVPSTPFSFSDGYIVMLRPDSGWFSIDTITGNGESHYFSRPSPSFGIYPTVLNGDTAYFLRTIYNTTQQMNFLKYDLVTGGMDSSLVVNRSYLNFNGMAANTNKIALSLNISSSDGFNSTTLVEYSAVTGEEIDSCSIEIPWYRVSLAYAGEDLWIAYPSIDGSNRIGRVDFSNGTIVESYENPLYESAGLAWDGTNFWVIDNTNLSFVKLLLERD